MEYKEGRLSYNRKNDRYGLLVTDLWEIDGFSCGNRLQVEINGEWVDTHMEMDWSTGKGVWYLTGTDLKGSALENNLFLNGYDVPSELDGQKIAFSESELTPDLLTNLAENNVRSVKVMSDKSIAAGYMDYLHKQKKDNKF